VWKYKLFEKFLHKATFILLAVIVVWDLTLVPAQQKYTDKVFVRAAAYTERKSEAVLCMHTGRTLWHSIKRSKECIRSKLRQTFAFNDSQQSISLSTCACTVAYHRVELLQASHLLSVKRLERLYSITWYTKFPLASFVLFYARLQPAYKISLRFIIHRGSMISSTAELLVGQYGLKIKISLQIFIKVTHIEWSADSESHTGSRANRQMDGHDWQTCERAYKVSDFLSHEKTTNTILVFSYVKNYKIYGLSCSCGTLVRNLVLIITERVTLEMWFK